MYILLEEELWAWLEIWKKTPGCRDERRESEGIGANQREEGKKMSKMESEWVSGALFIGSRYTSAVTSADVCMTVHFSAYQRCDENDGAFQRFQPLKWTAGVKVKKVKKLFNFFLFENHEVTPAVRTAHVPCFVWKKKSWPPFSFQRSTKKPLKRVPNSAVCAQPLKCKRPLYPFFCSGEKTNKNWFNLSTFYNVLF